jgi:hypothetical protein
MDRRETAVTEPTDPNEPTRLAPRPDATADPEAPEADALDQQLEVGEPEPDTDEGDIDVTDEVNEADRVEQSRVVNLDEDDYR